MPLRKARFDRIAPAELRAQNADEIAPPPRKAKRRPKKKAKPVNRATAETNPTKLPHGRPSRYRPELIEEAYSLALLGYTDAQIASAFGVVEETLNQWKRVHDGFSASIARGKELADAKVAKSLYERALGYSHPAVKIFMPAGAEKPIYADFVEHFPPDTTAASLWLRNRQPKLWRDKTDVQHSGSIGLEHWVLQSLTPAAPAIEGTAKLVESDGE